MQAWALGSSIAMMVALVLLVLYQPRISHLFHSHVKDRPKRRLLLAAIGFFVTFAAARGVAWSAYRNTGPFHYVYIGEKHIHHLVWGILLLLLVGFCWLIEVGTGERASSLLASRLMSLLYGVGAALTLDEFALWLNLEEGIYWTRRDRISIDAILLFGTALLIGLWGRDFLKALGIEMWRAGRRRPQ